MANKKQVGIFFGNNNLSIAEVDKSKLINFFDAPHGLFQDQQSAMSQNLPDDIRITAIIQKALRDLKIDATEVNLSLPIKDIILRTFFIPMMSTNEVKGVVEFEARRYVPFRLEDLVYGFHSLPIVDKKSRRLLVLFIAIKKEIYERYCAILDQSGLKVAFIEPSSLSLLRLLNFKKFIQRKQKTALVQIDQKEGTIIIVDQGIPQFVRDFLLVTMADTFELDQEVLSTRLLNEVRISLDYYRRQHSMADIENLLFVSSNETKELAESLGKNLNIPSTSLTSRTILGSDEEINTGVLNAFGVGLRGLTPFPVNINLRPQAKIVLPSEEEKASSDAINFTSSIKVGVICALVLVLGFWGFNTGNAAQEKKFEEMSKKESIYSSLAVDEIRKKKDDALNKINRYKNVRTKSNMSFFLERIPQKLPQGLWLTNFSINYEDVPGPVAKDSFTYGAKVTIDLSGLAFNQDPTRQITYVNNFINNLRQDPELGKIFSSITLKSANKQAYGDYTLTAFQVVCK